MTRHLTWLLLAVGTLFSLASPSWAQTADQVARLRAEAERAAGTPAAACKALAQADFTGIDEAPTQLMSAQFVEPKDGLPGYCLVRGYVWPQVGFELQLPVTNWNGRFIEIGCGGPCGTFAWKFWCPVYRGYACIVSDMGHQGGNIQAGPDGLWAYNNLQAQVDFGYRGVHVTAVAGKAITEHYYARAPKYSYFHGCSTGARQGLVEAQRFPWDFDGIIGGGVWVDDTYSTMNLLWANQALKGKDGKPLLSPADMQMIHEAVLARCDLDDGVKDGIISNPLACKFDPAELRCKAGMRSGCLTDVQVDAVQKVYAGPTTSTGVKLTPGGPVPGSEHRWIPDPEAEDSIGAVPFVARDGGSAGENRWAIEYFRWMVLPPAGRGWNLSDFDFDRDYKRFSNGVQESLISDTNPDLRKFKDAGGKLMLYQGWNDIALPKKAIDYYQTVERTMGGRGATQGFFRLFMVPGMNHCIGGEGAWAIDYLTKMEAWVERGQAPDVMIGAHVRGVSGSEAYTLRFPLDSGTAVSFTRPVYPYPLWAKYKGSGDPNGAENFKAVAP